MEKVKITAIRKTCCPDLMEKCENLIEHACDIQEGQVWIANGWQKPDGMCDSVWESMSAFVMMLAHGGSNFYDGWMKNPKNNAPQKPRKGFSPCGGYDRIRAKGIIVWKSNLKTLSSGI